MPRVIGEPSSRRSKRVLARTYTCARRTIGDADACLEISAWCMRSSEMSSSSMSSSSLRKCGIFVSVSNASVVDFGVSASSAVELPECGPLVCASPCLCPCPSVCPSVTCLMCACACVHAHMRACMHAIRQCKSQRKLTGAVRLCQNHVALWVSWRQ